MESILLLKVFAPTALAFTIGILIAPIITHYLYHFKAWKKVGGKTALGGQTASEFNRIKGEAETKTPRMGGIVIWGSVFITVFILFFATQLFPNTLLAQLDFFSRSQTWIPLSVLFIGAFVGFINDYYDITHSGKGIRLRTRIAFITILATAIASWFYFKLDVTSIGIPFAGELFVGILIIPFFILLTNAVYASGVIDGIDGLSGGVFVAIFSAYTGVAFIQSQYDLAAFTATVAGAILAFLWFNIPPARFWMTETGSMALTLTLAVVVFMTDNLGNGHGIALFSIIGLPLIATVLSNIYKSLTESLRAKSYSGSLHSIITLKQLAGHHIR
jgi:phospho-N-acetylmuramoyl-pentapeptide-transferase